MKTEKSGWGYIHYGNAGDFLFFDAFHKFRDPKKFDKQARKRKWYK